MNNILRLAPSYDLVHDITNECTILRLDSLHYDAVHQIL